LSEDILDLSQSYPNNEGTAPRLLSGVVREETERSQSMWEWQVSPDERARREAAHRQLRPEAGQYEPAKAWSTENSLWKELLIRYGHWIHGLETGKLQPFTKAQWCFLERIECQEEPRAHLFREAWDGFNHWKEQQASSLTTPRRTETDAEAEQRRRSVEMTESGALKTYGRPGDRGGRRVRRRW
jgi:uncharacterized protein YifE (UPF0438 family)